MNMKAYIAEFIGTFSLVLVGLTAAVLNLELSSIGLAFGLILMAMIYTLGNSSGGHFNPAVTFGMALTKRLSWKDFGLYIIAQLLGSLFAVLCLVPFIGSLDNLAANQVLTDFGVQTDLLVLLLALLVEVIATFIFVFVFLRVTKEKTLHMVSGLIIGLTLTALIYFTGNLTNASINPARSIFPALFQGGKALNELWIFIIGPMIGAFLASVAAPYFDSENS